MLKTRRREELIIQACLAGKTRFVVENTNLKREGRAAYIAAARGAGFRVIGYFFETRAADAVRRNAERAEEERVPPVGIYAASKRLEVPSWEEGFDELYRVELKEAGFGVKEF